MHGQQPNSLALPHSIRARSRWGAVADSLIDGKSIMSVMMLAASKGTCIHLQTEGEQEAEAMLGLTSLINNYFDEGE